MRVAVVGTGYVGLVSGACLAELGFTTWCIDTDAAKIERLKQGIMPNFEANLEDIVVSNHQGGRLLLTTSLAEAILAAAVVIHAVGKPENAAGSAQSGHEESKVKRGEIM